MILIIDNYDSFTYNLYQAVAELSAQPVEVLRNDQITLAQVKTMKPNAIILSPGPGRPEDSGICMEVIQQLGEKIPLLGVCLGHQAIGIAFGAKVVRAGEVIHGKASEIFHNGEGIYAGLPSPLSVGRYHSLVIDPNTLPEILEVTARTESGLIMGVRHKIFKIVGVQFHPESILSSLGNRIIQNFLLGLIWGLAGNKLSKK